MHDTPLDVQEIQLEVFHRMTPQQRFQLGIQMIADGNQILENRLHAQMPDQTKAEWQAKRFEILYQNELSPRDLSACLQGLKRYWA